MGADESGQVAAKRSACMPSACFNSQSGRNNEPTQVCFFPVVGLQAPEEIKQVWQSISHMCRRSSTRGDQAGVAKHLTRVQEQQAPQVVKQQPGCWHTAEHPHQRVTLIGGSPRSAQRVTQG
eukprot:357343-Chlamydomonas_euryale.AAC.4